MLRAATALPLAAILAVAALLRLWNLSANGYSREYYAAAVRGMLQSWHNTFFNSFDPGGFVTLDKPPVAIWFQALFAKLFGFDALNTLLPQVVLGLTAVLLLYFIVRRTFGERAALLAAAILAANPGNVAVDRSNNLESCLIVVLLLAVYLGIRAAETGRLRYLIAAMLLIGVGFNVKMAAAWIFAPTIALAFFAFNRQHSLMRHAVYQSVAGVLMLALSLSWVIAFDLTPADQRPYAGSTKNNSMIELVLKHNGTDRFTIPAATQTTSANEPQPELYDMSPAGSLRLFRALQAGQFAWLLPFAIAGILLGLRTSGTSRAQRITLAVFAGWLLSYWIVFSAASGPFHTYYLAALAPPLAALAGIGASEAWRRHQHGERFLIPLLLILTALWQAWLFYGQIGAAAPAWLLSIAIVAMLIVTASAYLFWTGAIGARPALGLFPSLVPFLALLALPLTAALSVVLIRPNVVAPVATLAEFREGKHPEDVARADPRRRDLARAKLIAFLSEQQKQEKFLVAVENALVAGPIIIATGKPVMTIGGYLGVDPILTPEKLASLAARGDIRFVMLGGLSLTKRNQPGEVAMREWVAKYATRVDPLLWSTAPHLAGKTFRIRIGGVLTEMTYPELYDLRPRTAR